MATLQQDISKLGRKNLLQAVKLYDPSTKVNLHADMAGNRAGDTQSFQEIAAYGGLDLPSPTDEYGTPPQTDYAQVYDATYTAIKWMLQFRISNEAFDDEQGYGIVRAYGRDMKSTFHQAMEMEAADRYMNLADSTAAADLGPDGAALAATNHPLADGSNYSTIITAETLSYLALTKMMTALKKQKAHKGYLKPIVGPYILEVSAENEFLAKQILQSAGQSDTANRADNVISSSISRVIVNPYFENADRFAIRAAANDEHHRFMWEREAFNLVNFSYDEDNDSWKATARARFLFSTMGARGVMYSLA